MITIIKKIFLYILSIILWIIWWTTGIITIFLLITISLIMPKKTYNVLVKIICNIMIYCVLIFPKHKGIPPKDVQYPVIFVANHVSFFDLFISGKVLPGNPRGFELKEHLYRIESRNKDIEGSVFSKEMGELDQLQYDRKESQSNEAAVEVLNCPTAEVEALPQASPDRNRVDRID